MLSCEWFPVHVLLWVITSYCDNFLRILSSEWLHHGTVAACGANLTDGYYCPSLCTTSYKHVLNNVHQLLGISNLTNQYYCPSLCNTSYIHQFLQIGNHLCLCISVFVSRTYKVYIHQNTVFVLRHMYMCLYNARHTYISYWRPANQH